MPRRLAVPEPRRPTAAPRLVHAEVRLASRSALPERSGGAGSRLAARAEDADARAGPSAGGRLKPTEGPTRAPSRSHPARPGMPRLRLRGKSISRSFVTGGGTRKEGILLRIPKGTWPAHFPPGLV
jgi:hypothetical protein